MTKKKRKRETHTKIDKDSQTYTKVSFYIDDIAAIKIVSNIGKKSFQFF